MSQSPPDQKRLFGLVGRRPRWAPTLRGWLLIVALAIGAGQLFLRTIHPFLAVSRPLGAKILVVEGWIPDYAIQSCTADIKAGKYDRIFTVGGPVTGVQIPAADDDTHAYVAAKKLIRMGANPSLVVMVPTASVGHDRTFQSALTLRLWFEKYHVSPSQIDVVTLGVHARRSRLLFQQALGDGYPVGIVATRNQDYDATHWWRYSEGVKEVISEGAAYLYARFLFYPSPAK